MPGHSLVRAVNRREEGFAVPLNRVFACIVFALWVSISAATPEILWEGFLVMRGHFKASEIYSVVFIGIILAFSVDPVMERLRDSDWELEHRNARDLLYTTLISLVFAMAAVCIHEAMSAYLGDEHAEDQAKHVYVFKAIEQVREWASIPFAVTIAWFVAPLNRWISVLAAVLACLWILAVGVSYGWEWRVLVSAAVPSCTVAALGCRFVSSHWDDKTFPALAGLTASVACCWFVLAWLAPACVRLLGIADLHLYTWTAFFEDVRFFLGWAVGLVVAPNPVPKEAAALTTRGPTPDETGIPRA